MVLCSSRSLSPYLYVCTFKDQERSLLHLLLKLAVLAFVPEGEEVGGCGKELIRLQLIDKGIDTYVRSIRSMYVPLCLRMWYRKLLAL